MIREGINYNAEDKINISVRDRLAIYMKSWPLFVVCMVVCLGAGYTYYRYTVPRFFASTLFMVKGAESGKTSSEDLIETALSGKRQVNLSNEMLLITSISLMRKTVARNDFNISYFKKGRLLTVEIYKDAPFRLVAENISDSNSSFTIYVKEINKIGGKIVTGKSDQEKSHTFKWSEPFNLFKQTFVLNTVREINDADGEYIAQWNPVHAAAAEFASNLSVRAYDTKSSVIEMSVNTGNLEQGIDLLNALFNEFNSSDINSRNRLSDSTVKFIDDRLIAITNELKSVEGVQENFQNKQQLVDVRGQSTQSLENSSDLSRTIKDINIQQGVSKMIGDYFAKPGNEGKLVPSALGLSDPTLTLLISQYNELQLKKEREAPFVAPKSTVMQDLNAQIGNLRGSILESLGNLSKNLQLQERNFEQQNSKYQNFLTALPRNERLLQEMKRKQAITEGLYLYLFQKREEAAISSTASNVAHYEQIDPADGYGPIEPNFRNILLYSSLLSFFLAFAIVFIRELMKNEVRSREDITSKTNITLLGQINHIPRRKHKPVAVLDRTVVAEQFRALRTNLSFILKGKASKVVLITSSESNEGKSFLSLNLAAVCALPGKKVALLELDIRKPVIHKELQIDNSSGITDFLAGDIQNINDIIHYSEDVPGLHVFPAGSIVMNPGDLLLTDNLSRLIQLLKAEYDYVFIDTPPAGLISDAFILGEHSDVVLYILRSGKTTLKQIGVINEIVKSKTLTNVALVLNDVRTGSGSYGYGGYYTDRKSETTVRKATLSDTI